MQRITEVKYFGSLSELSNEKRSPEFVGEFQAMIDNNPSQSIRSIARNMGMLELLIKYIVNEDFEHFSYKLRKSHRL